MSALSVRSDLNLSGLIDDWMSGILKTQLKGARAHASAYLLNSLPRYVMEVAALISVAAVIGGSVLLGDFLDNAPSAVVVLAGAFRISGALVPLQNAIHLVNYSNELSRSFTSFVDGIEPPINSSKHLVKAIEEKVVQLTEEPLTKAIIIFGKSGIGKTSALHQAIHNLKSSGVFGFGDFGLATQDSDTISGGLSRNLYLSYSRFDDQSISRPLSLERELEIEGVLARLQSMHAHDRPILSGGELSRLRFLRAHLGSPSLIFLDEPTTGLDRTMIHKLATIINRLPCKYVIITHDKYFRGLIANSSLVNLDDSFPSN